MFDNNNIFTSRLYIACEAITRIMILTLLFILFSLPIVTVGASLVALITTIRHPGLNIFSVFFKSFKENFVRSLVVMIFNIFTLMFLAQVRMFIGNIPMGNLLYFFILSFLLVYNLNAYLLVSILKKCNLTFFRQVFFFTIGSIYKTFFIPLIMVVLVIFLPIIGGVPALLMSLSISLYLYVKVLRKELDVIHEYL